MRLNKLRITKYKNLKDFTIDFDEKHMTTVFLGRNATAKSNLTEALVMIFKTLDLGDVPPFAYQLSYTCRGKTVDVDADPSLRPSLRIRIDGTEIIPKQFAGDPERRFLPKNVFGYYSGTSKRLEGLFERHQERFYRQLLENKDLPLRPLFYARTIHSQYVLLSYFSFKEDMPIEFLREYFGITDFINAEFILKQPNWYQKRKSEDDYFWGARGVVRGFLDDLLSIAIGPIKRAERVSLSYGKSKTEERIYLRIEDLSSLRKLAAKYRHNVDFFKTLESTYIADLIAELRIRVKKEGVEGSVEFTELSEGEQQLLTVLGLLRFTKEEESLFLLDEPDTHLNPLWKYKYIDLLNDVVGANETSHIIIVTHDPLVIGGLTKEQVKIFTVRDLDKAVIAYQPTSDPRGMGVTGLLTSELFGLPTTLDRETQRKLNRKKELATRTDRNPDEEEELRKLNEELEVLGFMTAFRDPDYTRYLKALKQYELSEKHVLTLDDIKKQEELDRKIIRKLKGAVT
jgi:predicted ATPase